MIACVPIPHSTVTTVSEPGAHRAADISAQQIAAAIQTLGWQLPGSVFVFGVFLGSILFESIITDTAQELARYLGDSISLFFASTGLHILHRHASTGSRISVTRFVVEQTRGGSATEGASAKQASLSNPWRVVKRETGILRFSKNVKYAIPTTVQTIQASIPIAPMKCLLINASCALWKQVGSTLSSKVVLPRFALSQYQTAVEQGMSNLADQSASSPSAALVIHLPISNISLPLVALRSPVEFAPVDTLFAISGAITVAALAFSTETCALKDLGLSARRILWNYFNLMETGGSETQLPTNIEWGPITSLNPENNAILCGSCVNRQQGTGSMQEALRAEMAHLRVDPETETEETTAAATMASPIDPGPPIAHTGNVADRSAPPAAPHSAAATTAATTTGESNFPWLVAAALVLLAAVLAAWLLGQHG